MSHKIIVGTPAECEKQINALEKIHHLAILGFSLDNGIVAILVNVISLK